MQRWAFISRRATGSSKKRRSTKAHGTHQWLCFADRVITFENRRLACILHAPREVTLLSHPTFREATASVFLCRLLPENLARENENSGETENCTCEWRGSLILLWCGRLLTTRGQHRCRARVLFPFRNPNARARRGLILSVLRLRVRRTQVHQDLPHAATRCPGRRFTIADPEDHLREICAPQSLAEPAAQ